MAKVRVYELAKEFGVESKAVMAELEKMGEFVRSASSTIEAPVVRRLKEQFSGGGKRGGSASGGGQNGGVVRIGGDLVGVFFRHLVGEPGLDLRGGSSALWHLKRCDDTPLVIDDGKAILQSDLVLAQDLVDRFAMQTRGRKCGRASGGAMRRGVD